MASATERCSFLVTCFCVSIAAKIGVCIRNGKIYCKIQQLFYADKRSACKKTILNDSKNN
jgi:hypothetical protein